MQYGSSALVPILKFPQEVQRRFLGIITSNALIGTVIGEVVAEWALFEDATTAVGPWEGSDTCRVQDMKANARVDFFWETACFLSNYH
jgi:hypothetical protein